MVVYSIKDLEKLSGIKAHTLRIWEKRYGIVEPKRTESNIRYYSDDDLELVLNIALLKRKGYKISKIAALSREEIVRLIAEISEINAEFQDHLDTLTIAMLELDEYKFNKILSHYIDQKGFVYTIEDVIYPFLDKLSVMWIAGSIKSVHESFVVHYIKRKCISEIEKLKTNHYKDKPHFVIFLPENENHELSLLFVHYLLKSRDIKVTNLGVQVPLLDIVDACNIINPDYIYTMINDSYGSGMVDSYVSDLLKYIKHGHIIMSGYKTIAQALCEEERVTCHSSIAELKEQIEEIVQHREN